MPELTLTDRIIELSKRRAGMVGYLRLKVDVEDWHGVADAAMDLREIDAALAQLKELAHA